MEKKFGFDSGPEITLPENTGGKKNLRDSAFEFLTERKNTLRDAVASAESFIRIASDRLIERKLRSSAAAYATSCA